MSDQTVSLIAAAGLGGEIGAGGGMPWHISGDFKYFKRITLGHPIIMGRLTWVSIGERPLPGRTNIVISRTASPAISDRTITATCIGAADATPGAGQTAPAASPVWVGSLKEALCAAGEGEVFVIGGGSIYRQAMPLASRIYLTRVHLEVPHADTFFPEIDPEEWEEISRSPVLSDGEGEPQYEFLVYERRKAPFSPISTK